MECVPGFACRSRPRSTSTADRRLSDRSARTGLTARRAGSVSGREHRSWRTLLDPLARFGTAVRAEQVDFVAARAGCQHHPFGYAKLHLACRQVGDIQGQAAFQPARARVGTLDTGEDVALGVADRKRVV